MCVISEIGVPGAQCVMGLVWGVMGLVWDKQTHVAVLRPPFRVAIRRRENARENAR